MLVSLLTTSNKENKIFRAEVIEKVEVCEGNCRVLLRDNIGDYVYCFFQGLLWQDKIKNITIGQKIILAPSKIIEVPPRYKKFYTPDVNGKQVSPLFFQYNSHDFDLGIRIDPSLPKPTYDFVCLNEVRSAVRESSKYFSIVSVIVDFYIKPDQKVSENSYRFKLIDESIDMSDYMTLNAYMRKICTVKQISIGDILVAQNSKFIAKGNNCYGQHSKGLGSLAIFSWVDGKVEFCIENFVLTDSVTSAVCRLQNWIFTNFQYVNMVTKKTIFSINSVTALDTFDAVLYMIHIIPDYPEFSRSILVFCEPSSFAYMEAPSSAISHIKVNCWVKLSKVSIAGNRILISENSSIIAIPEWSSLVKSRPCPSSSNTKHALMMFTNATGIDSCVAVNTKHSQAQNLDCFSLVNPNEPSPYGRIYGIVVDFNPRNLGLGVHRFKNRLVYSSVIIFWMQGQLVTILVCGRNSDLFFGISEYDEYGEIVKKVEKVQRDLFKGSSMVELGVQRIVKDGKVVLILSETEIKSFN